ncbi:MAG: hypothetical protein Tsb0010_03060 [Parvularculaceae bacterium]
MTRALDSITLIISGAVASAVGIALLAAPKAFFGLNNIELPGDPDMMSEIRAPGALLLTLGGVIVSGAFDPRRARMAMTVSAAVYLSYGCARIASLLLDGVPGAGLLAAMGIEFGLGGIAFWRRLRSPALRLNHNDG